ncbi:MAG TPA: PP2C family protein-serine/threonine phosphatase [Thermoanaerobaculia bacterium]|nr:PP2C family protein-serine/threonine phosphatase [Thermoanaerobaculia bacterium]
MTSHSPPTRTAVVLRLLAGAAVLAAGFAAGGALLPTGRAGSLPDKQAFVDDFRAAARRQGAALSPGTPRVRLLTPGDKSRVARRLLGERADEWLARHGRGLQVEVSQNAQWGPAQGRLEMDFSATREPWEVNWEPASVTAFFSSRAPQPEGICGMLLRRGETIGARRQISSSQQAAEALTPIVGTAEPGQPEYLYLRDPAGATILCSRGPGTVTAAALDLEAHGWTSGWPKAIAPVVLVVFALVLFLILAFRGRVDLWNALLLAGLFFVTAIFGDWPKTVPNLFVHTVTVPPTAMWLLLLWAGAESWARARLPDFTTTLDTLRRGRLGARAGRELLAGWAAGAALAGLRVGLLALAVVVPGVEPGGNAAALPLFGLGGHPLRRAMIWVAALLIALVVGRGLGRRWAVPLALLVVPLVLTPIGMLPWLAQYGAGVLLTGLLLWLLRRSGLLTALVAALLAGLLPTAALALRYADWVPVTAGIAAVAALLPLVAGFVGLARGEAIEQDPGAVPEFMRREERQRRLTYEMDLLARMQTGLLPQGLPRLAGYEVTARSILATEAGGDLYDFLRDDRGRLWIAAGDVSGHGYSCAIGQASVKAALLSLVDGHATPARILERVDRVVRGTSVGTRQFVTLCLACLELDSGRLLISNAGHPFPLLALPQQQPRELDVPGLPLGQGPARRYRDLEVTIPKGSVLLLYSDGLYESTDLAGNPYGFERPSRILAGATAWNAAEVMERLLFDWRRHLGGAAAADDTTLVVLKRQ